MADARARPVLLARPLGGGGEPAGRHLPDRGHGQPGLAAAAVYGADHWYFQWGAFTFTGVLGLVGIIYYLVKLRGSPGAVLAEHRAAAVAVADEPA